MPDTNISILNSQFQSTPPNLLGAPVTGAQASFPSFCQAWPLVKPILSTLGVAIAWIPVYGQAASLVYNGLLQIAENEYQLNCTAGGT